MPIKNVVIVNLQQVVKHRIVNGRGQYVKIQNKNNNKEKKFHKSIIQ